MRRLKLTKSNSNLNGLSLGTNSEAPGSCLASNVVPDLSVTNPNGDLIYTDDSDTIKFLNEHVRSRKVTLKMGANAVRISTSNRNGRSLSPSNYPWSARET